MTMLMKITWMVPCRRLVRGRERPGRMGVGSPCSPVGALPESGGRRRETLKWRERGGKRGGGTEAGESHLFEGGRGLMRRKRRTRLD